DVCLSVRAWERKRDRLASLFPTWRTDPVTTASLWWEWHVREGREQGSRLGSDLYCEVRYERLVAQPEAECAKLCTFLGLAYEDRMLDFHEGRRQAGWEKDAKNAWLPIMAGLRDWRIEMPVEDQARCEGAVRDLLVELRYTTSELPPSGDVTE